MKTGQFIQAIIAAWALAGCAAITATGVASPAEPIAYAPGGPVQGTSEDGINAFRGIPFAEAPVGERRWKAPEPKAAWNEIRDARQFGASCIQLTRNPAASSIYLDDLGATSEDCLSLNIWAKAGASKAPVFVWIHGGALVSGSSRFGMYDGTSLARKGLVFVSVNYRLGPLGYLAHPGLSAENPDGISGNYGLQDQIAALRWVKENIAAFGGDPDNVTIAGESSGALSVMYLMASSHARGLFDRAISQSGYMISSPALSTEVHGHHSSEAQGLWLQNKLGAESLASMRAMDAQELTDKAFGSGFLTWGTIDGKLLPRQTIETFERGEQAPVPLLAGFNSGEIRSLRRLLAPAPASAREYVEAIRARYGDLSDRFLAIYPETDIDEAMLATTRDALYGWTAEQMVRGQTRLGQDAWLYLFDHGYPAAERAGLHAFHASEIPYVLGNTDRTTTAWPAIPQSESEHRFASAMLDYWSSFARGEAPKAVGAPFWPAYGDAGQIMVFRDSPEVRSGGIGPAYALQDEIVCRRRAAGNLPWHWNVGMASPVNPEAMPQCR